jgi:hypothetical protein
VRKTKRTGNVAQVLALLFFSVVLFAIIVTGTATQASEEVDIFLILIFVVVEFASKTAPHLGFALIGLAMEFIQGKKVVVDRSGRFPLAVADIFFSVRRKNTE